MSYNAQTKPLQIIKASAGSGKTFQLAYEYIKLLLGKKNDDGTFRLAKRTEYHEHILAVTFTNKATEEMKSRIVKELNLLSQGKGEYIGNLEKDLNTTREQIMPAARTALEEILFNYATFNVSTIDSFFQTVLRTFAFELDQDYDYIVETDSEHSLEVAVHNVLMNVGCGATNHIVENWFSDYMRHLLDKDNPGAWNVFTGSKLSTMAKNITKEWYVRNKVAIDDYLNDVFSHSSKTKIMRFKSKLYEIYEKIGGEIPGMAETYMSILSSVDLSVEGLSSKSGLTFFTNSLIKNKSGGVDEVDKFLNNDDVKVANWSTDKEWKKAAKTGQYDFAVGKLKELAIKMRDVIKDRSLIKDMLTKIYLFGLLGIIGKELEIFLRDNDTVLLSDTSQLLDRVMIKSNVMFVYERMGTWINHFLIDEFQDTSALQYRNMKPLLEESVACGNENLVIGDEKQCIYRFRDSDPDLLAKDIINDFDGGVHVDITKVVNWRSTPNVIKFNNSFFWNLVRMTGVEDVYDNVLQKGNNKNHCNDGAVKITFVSGTSGGKGKEIDKSEFADIVLDRLPSYINEIRSRGYRLKDIAILVRANDQGSKIIDRLLEYNKTADENERIEVVSAESMFLRKSPAVRSVISYLRYFDTLSFTDSDNAESNSVREKEERIKRVLRDFDHRVSNHRAEECVDTESEEFGMEVGDLLKAAFVADSQRQSGQTSKLQYSKEYLDVRSQLMSSNVDAFDLVSIVENIVCRVVSDETRESEKAFLMGFMDNVIDYCSKYNATVHSFLKWWDTKPKLSVSTPEGRDAVNIITIHKSKGLEFPCVIIPFANWEMCKLENELWVGADILRNMPVLSGFDEEIIPPLMPVSTTIARNVEQIQPLFDKEVTENYVDNINATYVAFTRAVNELHLMAPDCEEGIDDISTVRVNKLLKTVCAALTDANAGEIDNWFAERTGDRSSVATSIISQVGENDTLIYQVGDINQTYVPKDEPQVNDVDNGELPMEVPKYESALRPVSVCVPETYSPIQDRGIRLHKLFSMLKRAGSCDSVLARAWRRGLLDGIDDAETLVKKALNNAKTAPWFADGNVVFNERSIVCGDGSVKRPDRIIRTCDGRVIVVDYKFGNDHSRDAKYRKQVRDYICRLGEAGLKVDEGYVWYPESDIIINVFDDDVN